MQKLNSKELGIKVNNVIKILLRRYKIHSKMNKFSFSILNFYFMMQCGKIYNLKYCGMEFIEIIYNKLRRLN